MPRYSDSLWAMVVDPLNAFSLLGRLPLLTKAWLVLNLVEVC